MRICKYLHPDGEKTASGGKKSCDRTEKKLRPDGEKTATGRRKISDRTEEHFIPGLNTRYYAYSTCLRPDIFYDGVRPERYSSICPVRGIVHFCLIQQAQVGCVFNKLCGIAQVKFVEQVFAVCFHGIITQE